MKKGDYIKDKDCSLIQGEIEKAVIFGRYCPCWQVRRPDGKILFIRQGDAVKLGGDYDQAQADN